MIYTSNSQGHNEIYSEDVFLWRSTLCIFKFHRAFLSLGFSNFILVNSHFNNVPSFGFPFKVLFLFSGSPPFLHPCKHEDMLQFYSASITNHLSYRIRTESGVQCLLVLSKHPSQFFSSFQPSQFIFQLYFVSDYIICIWRKECALKAAVTILPIQIF